MTDHTPQRPADSQLGPVLGNTFRAMASYPDAAPLAAAMPRVHRRVAGRRAARIGGITVGAAALAVGMAVGTWSAPWDDHTAPVIPAVPAPSPSTTAPTPEPSTPSPAPSTSPTGEPPTVPSTESPATEERSAPGASRTALEDPRFTDGVPLPLAIDKQAEWECGESIDVVLDLDDRSRATLAITGDVALSGNGRALTPVMITAQGDGIPVDYEGGYPLLLWTQDGRIVHGHPWSEGDGKWYPRGAWLPDGFDPSSAYVEQLLPNISVETFAYSDTGWNCGTRVPGERGFPDPLPAGEYTVYAVAWYRLPDPEDTSWHTIVSDPVSVTVPSS